ncbi:glycosyltransferase family 90 protein [Metarhizium album ARSEF 1941]|uniref:Glycosyltransferase family 90 protein n=1 Tax=Metarhizium album (strain ARSEF 1941) TaxID=1081103 RepID=A0A0B2WSS2_METAS|nr:glycosyltransferase family 90 protein [Metarhizium album ARSEF 1941]KHN96537.1 glycosyltransferase family 90 protein [Metarhizium album ARSEF 1941]
MLQTIRNGHGRGLDATLRAMLEALLAGVAAQYFTSRSSELYSEMLSWALLPLLITYIRRPNRGARLGDASLSLGDGVKLATAANCIVAVGLAVATFCAAESDWVRLIPALTPALLAVQAKLHGEALPLRTRLSAACASTTTWHAVAAAVFGVCTLSSYWSKAAVRIAAVEFGGLLFAYATLALKTAGHRGRFPRRHGQVHFLGFVPFGAAAMIMAGVAKSYATFRTVEVVHDASWAGATVVKMLTIFASRNPFIQSSHARALLHIVGSALTLGQLVALTPKHVSRSRLLWAFMLVPLVPYLAQTAAIRGAQSRMSALSLAHKHPVEEMMDEASSRFEAMLERQSNSSEAASDEYRRRYKMEPPPGFEAWCEYAAARESRIVDDFDAMYSSIAPFWALSGLQVRQAMREMRESAYGDVWTCTYSSKSGHTGCTHPWRDFDRYTAQLFNQHVPGGIPAAVPDVEFLVNHLDEPSVLLPRPVSGAGGIRETQLSERPIWARLVQHCDAERQQGGQETTHASGLPFVRNKSADMDLCRHREYEHMHGLFMSPTSMRLLEGMAPVLSTGAPSTMGDILFPSPAYTEDRFAYRPEHDVGWDAKRNNLYWTGSTTGGFASAESQWSRFHRQRFVGLAQNLAGGRRLDSSFLNSRLYDVAFTGVLAGDRGPLRQQTFAYRTRPWEDANAALRSRLVFDLDGNGISGRWYRLLASGSAPLKQTLLREWHDDRLVPWVHYVPVSQGMDELPELVAFLTSSPRGEQLARRIAGQGAEWFRQALRREDMSVYLYRLLLELARLQDPERPAHPVS